MNAEAIPSMPDAPSTSTSPGSRMSTPPRIRSSSAPGLPSPRPARGTTRPTGHPPVMPRRARTGPTTPPQQGRDPDRFASAAPTRSAWSFARVRCTIGLGSITARARTGSLLGTRRKPKPPCLSTQRAVFSIHRALQNRDRDLIGPRSGGGSAHSGGSLLDLTGSRDHEHGHQ